MTTDDPTETHPRLAEYRALRARRDLLEREREYEVRASAGMSTLLHQLTDECNKLEGRLALRRQSTRTWDPPNNDRAIAAYRAEEDLVVGPVVSPFDFDLAFMDVETSGTNEKLHEIVELAIIRTDPVTLEEKARLHRYFMPLLGVPEEAAKINGYNEKLWVERGAEPITRKNLDEIAEFVKGAAFVGQVIGFDQRFLWEEYDMRTIERPKTDYHVIDVATFAWPLVRAGKVRGMSLKYSRKFFGLAGEQAHTAIQDVLDEIEVYKHFMRAYVKAWEGVEPRPPSQPDI